MSRRKPDERQLEELEQTLRTDREPPANRIAILRAQADERRMRSGAPARTSRVGRRQLIVGGAAASIGAAAGVGIMAAADEDPTASAPTEQVAVTGDATASAELINHTWGVEYMLTVEGLRAEREYRVVYETTGGERVDAGSFIGVEQQMLCRMTAGVLRENARAIEVVDGDAVVLRSDLA